MAGKVDYNLICPSCNTVGMTLVGGFVKGVNTTPKNPADKQVWLVEARLYRESSFKHNGVSLIKDTVNIKQYFYPNFVFN